MTRRFTSTVVGPVERGEEFGSTFATEVGVTIAAYARVFAQHGSVDLDHLGGLALERIDAFAPDLGQEIRGIAHGADQPVTSVAAINARTEILAITKRGGQTPMRGECSTVVSLGDDNAEPVAVQTWDWYADLAGNWLEWTIPFADGRRVTTVTEFGIVGKIGVSAHGLGLLFNILHHRDDGVGLGVPVHIVARHILDHAPDVATGLAIIGSVEASASTTITLIGSRAAGKTAIATEIWPGGPGHVLPTADGLLLHTNHFLTDPGRLGDREPVLAPDTLVRYDVLRRGLHRYRGRADADQVLRVMADHTGALCCHPDPADSPGPSYATLATVRLDVATGQLSAHAGGPCTLVTPERSLPAQRG